MSAGRVLATAAAVGVSGCFLLVDTAGLVENRVSDASTPDESVSDASTPDGNGASDASIPDAEVQTADTAPIDASGRPSPCATGTFLLCDDFDKGVVLPGTPWDGSFVDISASVERTESRYTSAPGSLRAHTPAANVGTFPSAYVIYNSGLVSSGFRLSFDLLVSRLDPDPGKLTPCVVGFRKSDGSRSSIRVDVYPAKVSFREEIVDVAAMETLTTAHDLPFAVGLDRWTRIEVAVSLTNQRLTGRINDNEALIEGVPLERTWTAAELELDLGVFFTQGTTTGSELYIDNVSLDRRE